MNKTVLTIGGIAVVGVIGLLLFTSGSNTPKQVENSNTNTQTEVANNTKTEDADTDGDGLPDNAEVLLGTDPQNPDTNGNGVNDKLDPNPTQAEAPVSTTEPVKTNTETNPVKTESPTPATKPTSVEADDFRITSVLVENNVNPATGKDASDHLEIFLKSSAKSDITGLSLYYTITDLVTKVTQSYTVPLTGFTLKAGETKSVHVDTTGEAGHFRANPNSLYYQSQNEMRVDVVISASGHKSQTGTVTKDKGGAEEAD